MKIESNRLFLRPLERSDAQAYCRLSANEGFRRFQISNYQKASAEESENWILTVEQYHQRNGFGIVGVFLKESRELIGLGAIKHMGEEANSPLELMYRISDKYWGRGYGEETAQALCSWAFKELNLSSLIATVDPANEPSKRILRKLNFEFQELISIEGQNEELFVLRIAGFPSF